MNSIHILKDRLEKKIKYEGVQVIFFGGEWNIVSNEVVVKTLIEGCNTTEAADEIMELMEYNLNDFMVYAANSYLKVKSLAEGGTSKDVKPSTAH
ncbi:MULTISPECIES: hypothetical protein [unclassified Paenibacillus]|uniref:hypothetical protein n=1 Tax=unclassified Paenibacillus TaxID=185978 RepID=UPI00020D7BAE|nr:MULTISPECIES: hypothetical protein [unclassified Paenibacillus]EGL18564.1 hypothetical protein HMPREF9413_5920 [Paenibacillus sp. HGF7]EPD80518.1 hypothetical protein HMPREF1207_05624 [Paenibacillus sp. HGH0039]